MKKKDYSSIILVLLTIVFVSLCIIFVNVAESNIFLNRQTTTTYTPGNTPDNTTTTQDKLNTVVINISTTESSTVNEQTTAESTEHIEETASSTQPPTETTPIETSTIKDTSAEASSVTTSAEAPSTTIKEQPTTDTAPLPSGKYDYSKPVPASAPVDDNYFLDALFLGDSLTDGLALYSGLSTATFYSKQALSTSTAFTTPAVTIGEEKLSIIDAMKVTNFNKVYIMLGINEVGYPSPNSFIKKYEQIIDSIREVNSNATIYIQLILPITAERSETHKYIKNSAINKFNNALIELAAKKQVYYLNIAESLADESGALIADASTDGIHLKKSYYKIWLEYLKNHVIA